MLYLAGYPDADLLLKFVTFIGVIAAIVQILEMVLDQYFPPLYNVCIFTSYHCELRIFGGVSLMEQMVLIYRKRCLARLRHRLGVSYYIIGRYTYQNEIR